MHTAPLPQQADLSSSCRSRPWNPPPPAVALPPNSRLAQLRAHPAHSTNCQLPADLQASCSNISAVTLLIHPPSRAVCELLPLPGVSHYAAVSGKNTAFYSLSYCVLRHCQEHCSRITAGQAVYQHHAGVADARPGGAASRSSNNWASGEPNCLGAAGGAQLRPS